MRVAGSIREHHVNPLANQPRTALYAARSWLISRYGKAVCLGHSVTDIGQSNRLPTGHEVSLIPGLAGGCSGGPLTGRTLAP